MFECLLVFAEYDVKIVNMRPVLLVKSAVMWLDLDLGGQNPTPGKLAPNVKWTMDFR